MESIISLLSLVFFIYLMAKVMGYVFKLIGLGFLFSNSNSDDNSSGRLSQTATNSILAYFKNQKIKNKTGFMNKSDEGKLFKFRNKGLLLDGKNKRLSLKDT